MTTQRIERKLKEMEADANRVKEIIWCETINGHKVCVAWHVMAKRVIWHVDGKTKQQTIPEILDAIKEMAK